MGTRKSSRRRATGRRSRPRGPASAGRLSGRTDAELIVPHAAFAAGDLRAEGAKVDSPRRSLGCAMKRAAALKGRESRDPDGYALAGLDHGCSMNPVRWA